MSCRFHYVNENVVAPGFESSPSTSSRNPWKKFSYLPRGHELDLGTRPEYRYPL